MITFDDSNFVNQRFPFRNTLWNYVLKNLQPQHLLKLYQCCKFFYAKYRQNIILNLKLVDEGEPETFDPNTTIIRASNSALKKLKDFWITDSFVYSAPMNKKIMPFFSHCTIKKLDGCNYLIWEEYEALTKAGTVEVLNIGGIRDDGVLVSIDKIIAQVPNATSIEITETILSSTTCVSLAALNHQVKITKFVLHNIYDSNNFNIDLLFEFLGKNADLDCKVHFAMDFFMNDHLKKLAIEYTNIIAARLEEKKKELALEESTLMP